MREQDNLQQQYATQREGSSKIDISQLVYLFLSKWYLFTISVVVLLAIGCFFIKTRPQIYESKASVLIRVEQSAPEELFLLQDLGLNMTGRSNRDNEIGTIKSLSLTARVVTSLELYTTYRRKTKLGFYSPELYKQSPLYVRMEGVDPEQISENIELIFSPIQTGFRLDATYFLQGQKKKEQVIIEAMPAFIELEIGKFYVDRQTTDFGTEPLKVTISNAMSVAQNFINSLEVDNSIKTSSLLYITLKTENREKGKDFISALVSEYNHDAAMDKNRVAFNTSLFIEERIKSIANELGEVEEQVESFRRQYKVANIETQIGSFIHRDETYESRRVEVETQLNLLHFIESYIKNPANSNNVLPNLGIKDPSLIGLINAYNTLLISRERIGSSTSTDNPSLKQIDHQVLNLNQNIILSISNEIRASEITLQDLERESRITSTIIGNVPTLERQFTEILRQQKVKHNLFVYLLQKREEANLTQAAVAPKAKTITKSHSGEIPVAPRKALILLLFFFIGLTIPAIVLFIIDFFQTKITGVNELERLVNSSVIGYIAKVSDIVGSHSLVLKSNDTSVIAEMFRTMRNNLLFMTRERAENIILVTSTIPKEGKTFISVNLAHSLEQMDKKVLIIGGDLRNPKIGSALGVPKRAVGLSSYFAGFVQDYSELIEHVQGNLYAIQAGSIPPNPNELLSKTIVGKFFSQIQKEFDYGIVDSAPVGVVSDTLLIAPCADVTIYVVRENYSGKDTIQFINNLTQDQRLKNVGVILNQATGSAHSRYKYGYRYSYKYSYRYG